MFMNAAGLLKEILPMADDQKRVMVTVEFPLSITVDSHKDIMQMVGTDVQEMLAVRYRQGELLDCPTDVKVRIKEVRGA